MKTQTHLPEIEPWPEPVNGELLLNELLAIINRFVVLPKWAGETLALWTLHTYAFHLRDVSTYLGIESPEKRCGKTTLLTVLSELNLAPSPRTFMTRFSRPLSTSCTSCHPVKYSRASGL